VRCAGSRIDFPVQPDRKPALLVCKKQACGWPELAITASWPVIMSEQDLRDLKMDRITIRNENEINALTHKFIGRAITG